MANKNILTTYAKTVNTQLNYFAPNSYLINSAQPLESIYAFLAKVDPWSDDADPPQPTQDQKYLKYVMKSIFAVKKVTGNDISLVAHRIDWATGVVYDYYEDDVDILEKDENGYPVYNFYIRNRYDQVFKCLWNNNGAASTYEPFFEPGVFYTNNLYQNADGYKWKYLYTIDQGAKIKFMDSNWIPVPISLTAPNPYLTKSTAGVGNIDVINVVNGGSGYRSNNLPTIRVVGDGTAANGTTGTSALAYAVVSGGGVLTDIVVTNTGKNYTFANVEITSVFGANATAVSPVSPIGGHGQQLANDLGVQTVMYSVEFDGAENGVIPTDINFHQLGILVNPTAISFNPPYTNTPQFANGAIYSTTTNLVTASGFGVYVQDEVVYQGASLETATFTGVVVNFDAASNTIKVINTKGVPVNNRSIYGVSSQTARTLLSYNTPDFSTLSGNFIYLENRSEIQRSSDGIEQFKVVIGY
jgi:hypothetical protein